MSKTTYNIPEELLVRIKNLLAAVGHHGVILAAGEPPCEIGGSEIKEAQDLYELLLAATEKPEPTMPQHPEPFAYYRRGRGHEMLFASDLDAGSVPGDDWTPLYTHPQPAVPEADELRSALSDVVSVAITMLYDSHKPDVVEEFTIDELKDVVERTKHLQDARVEDVYRAGYRLLTTPTPTTTPQVDGWISMADREPTKSDEDCEGKIWLLWPDRRYFERVPRGHVSCAPEFYWMPTGLKRPQPPKGGEQ